MQKGTAGFLFIMRSGGANTQAYTLWISLICMFNSHL